MEKAFFKWFIKQTERLLQFKEKSRLLCKNFKEIEKFNDSDEWFQSHLKKSAWKKLNG